MHKCQQIRWVIHRETVRIPEDGNEISEYRGKKKHDSSLKCELTFLYLLKLIQ